MNNSIIETYLEDAIRQIDAWEIPASERLEAINTQARIMAGLYLEPSWDLPLDDPYQPLQF